MYFKDVITELKAELMKIMKSGNKNPLLCPHCQKGTLKRNSELEHQIEVAVRKFVGATGAGGVSAPIFGAGAPLGGAVPAPDYWFMCPKCKRIFIMVETLKGDQFVNINVFDRIFSFGDSNKKKKQGGGRSQSAPPPPEPDQGDEGEE